MRTINLWSTCVIKDLALAAEVIISWLRSSNVPTNDSVSSALSAHSHQSKPHQLQGYNGLNNIAPVIRSSDCHAPLVPSDALVMAKSNVFAAKEFSLGNFMQ